MKLLWGIGSFMSGMVPSSQTTSASSSVERPFPLKSRWLTTQTMLLLMTLLELVWLAGIWVTGATAATHKLFLLMGVTIILGAAVLLMPDRFLAWIPLENGRIATVEARILLVAGLLLGIILIYFAAEQRVWTFDEEGNLRAATAVANDGIRALFENYDRRPWLGKQHPPLVPIMYGLVMNLLGTSQLAGRTVTVLFALGNGLLTYFIGRRLFDRRSALLGGLLLFSFPLVFRLGAAAMVETALTFFFTLTALLTLRLAEKPTIGRLLLVGLAIGAGLLSKYTMVFVLPLVFGIIMVQQSFKQAVRYLGVMGLVGAMLLAGWLLFANQLDVLQQQLATVWEYAGLVLTNEYGRRVLFESMTNRLPSGLGVYNLPLLALGTVFVLNRRQKADWILLIWILSVWLPLSLTLPDHRYFLPSFPALALLAGLGLQQIPTGKLTSGTVRGLLLSLLLAASTLYLYVDWVRAVELFE
ncbi:MAG: glycosyltransferase family 39 protein [Ardenticatenaceae bacterium]|nr:glycosyltransferase family 39 protein [Anaerolineales bacterium]MCB8940803.1 glycosyltransferase family 39 protein [Ardenticatenaceae bacterium]MCB8972142.1 glycosyltransferase family 39 protein [Ardenticatenaceae bacterium]